MWGAIPLKVGQPGRVAPSTVVKSFWATMVAEELLPWPSLSSAFVTSASPIHPGRRISSRR